VRASRAASSGSYGLALEEGIAPPGPCRSEDRPGAQNGEGQFLAQAAWVVWGTEICMMFGYERGLRLSGEATGFPVGCSGIVDGEPGSTQLCSLG
jgi:hypothetical protein